MSAPILRRRPAPLVPPVCAPRPPAPGRGPTMIVTPSAPARTPLITVQVHDLICGFTSTDLHPHDRALARCRGCGLWLFLPSVGDPR